MQESKQGRRGKRKTRRQEIREGGKVRGDSSTYPFRRHWFFVVRDVRDADPLIEQRDSAVADAEEEELEGGREGRRERHGESTCASW